MELSRPDESCSIVRMRAASIGRTVKINRPERGPTEAIYIPQIAAHSILPHKILLFGSL
jgi:hypothetical protein